MPIRRLERGSLRETGARALCDAVGLFPPEITPGYDEAIAMLRLHTGDGAKNARPDIRIVNDPEVGLFRYRAGVWRQISELELHTLISEYDTCGYGQQGKQINLSKDSTSSAAWMGRLVVSVPDYFKEEHPGVAFRDYAIVIYEERYQPADLAPFLRLRVGIPGDMPAMLRAEDCHTLPPFDPRWLESAPSLEYIRDVIGDDQDNARALQEMMGLGLLGAANRPSKGIALLGPPGGGKGTVADIIRQLFPPEMVYEGPPVSTMKQDYARVVIVGKRLCVHNDVDDLGSIKEINRVISGEGILVRWMGDTPFTTYPSAFVLMTLNDLPSLKSKESGGVFRRWRIINCDRELHTSKKTRQDILAAAKADIPNLAAWALAGAARYMMTKKVSDSEASNLEVTQWRSESMPWLEWIAASLVCEPPPERESWALPLKAIIDRWAKDNDSPRDREMVEKMTSRSFAAGIAEVHKANTWTLKHSAKVYTNLRWKTPAERRASDRWPGSHILPLRGGND